MRAPVALACPRRKDERSRCRPDNALVIDDLVLLERSDFASGSSGKPIGGVRAQFPDALNIQLAARSLTAYERFGQTPGADIDLDKGGYLFLLLDMSPGSRRALPYRTSMAFRRG
jgi:sarcosine oxidase subunit beta